MPFTFKKATGRAGLTSGLFVCLVLLSLLWVPKTAASASSPADARITAVKRLDARMLDLTIQSPAMRGSVPVRVILPESWNSDKTRTFPVLYMLHGGNDDYTSWTRETDIEALARNSDVLIVMPDGGEAGQYSDWFAGWPNWETFHTSELVRLMEQRFRANSHRAIIGLSMGGLGALNYAARHRGMYRYVAAFSPTVDIDDPSIRAYILLGNVLAGNDVDYSRVWGDPAQQAANWEAHNPSAMAWAYRGMKVHLSVGNGGLGPLDQNRDPVAQAASTLEGVLLPDVEKFAASLRASGVDVSTHIYSPGTHSWPYWERELHLIWGTVMRELEH
ncbi:esterase family protein [Streptomyces sp. RB6PN25]|uniref:Esterase family protein n=1 Tax=Streptomyces humicola TaxID=2953240 RepID=A0ABT1PT55_9ACTN|nr:alpha/beta hydrolase family protein [Streptomyces humicola]MCQ4079732.1 esterase family protein [Streptomyces humicola]